MGRTSCTGFLDLADFRYESLDHTAKNRTDPDQLRPDSKLKA
jgi:hypothetical protein